MGSFDWPLAVSVIAICVTAIFFIWGLNLKAKNDRYQGVIRLIQIIGSGGHWAEKAGAIVLLNEDKIGKVILKYICKHKDYLYGSKSSYNDENIQNLKQLLEDIVK